MNKAVLFFTLLCGFMGLNAQEIREFSGDYIQYMVELSDFMGELDEDQSLVFEDFKTSWLSGTLSDAEKSEIISVSNHMLRRRARPVPHFINYLDLLQRRGTALAENVKLDNWIDSYHRMMAGQEYSFNVIQRSAEIVLQLLNENVLYNLAGTRWKVDHRDYSFLQNDTEPLIRFRDVDLECRANKDSFLIYNTSGDYYLNSLKWEGNGGMVTWEKAGYSAQEVYAELSNYTIEINRSQYQADSVLFYHKKYFSYPITGRLEEMAKQVSSPSRATFPKFFSYQSSFYIPDLFREISYLGSLSMQGAKLIGTGTAQNPARLDIYKNDTLRMIIRSENILISLNSMSSSSVEMTLRFKNDSVYHPDVGFLYLEERDEFMFNKRDMYTSGVAFSNSYHNVEMDFEELSWIRPTPEVKMKPSIGRAIGAATFQSNRFFDYEFFSELQGRDLRHPLVSLWDFSGSVGGARVFPLTAYSGIIGMPDYQVRHQMMKLSRLGFLYFDDQKDMISLNDKLFYFIEASIGKTDFDAIFFNSNVRFPNENAMLNLNTLDMTINGIQQISLSDSQNVKIFPADGKITMGKNKSFRFGGMLEAGLFHLYGDNFFFNYDSFAIQLESVDSLKISMLIPDEAGGLNRIVDIQNIIQDLKGNIIIDEPDNKSGRKYNPQYPILESTDYSYVYFEDPAIQNGVYRKEDVYFSINPFTIESIDNFERDEVELIGVFNSSGILPPIEENLTLREDNSLGFTYATPEEGIPVYDGKGVFYQDLDMGKNGLRGAGKLEYLTSTSFSDDFVFHPDSLMTSSREFYMERDEALVRNPDVNSRNNSIKWLTLQDKMRVDQQDIPFTLFNDSIRLDGDLILEPTGLSGSGTVDLVTASVASSSFDFRRESFFSDSAGFNLKSATSEKLALQVNDVSADVNLNSKTGVFLAKNETAAVDFPDIQYATRLERVEWNMSAGNILLTAGEITRNETGEDGLAGPRYYSTHPGQDSLNFVAPEALYDHATATLTAMEVPYIQIADARIAPKDGKIEVESKARIRQLTGATIVADYRMENFLLSNANVSIKSRNDYTASADYEYIDRDKTIQTIHFNQISVDDTGQTIALTEIKPEQNFLLSPYFEFQGEVELAAKRTYLNFDGGVRLRHSCSMEKYWHSFDAEINPDSIMIPVPADPRTLGNNLSFVGTFVSRDSTHIYSTFFSRRKDYFDGQISTSEGYLRFNRSMNRYEIAGIDKLSNMDLPGDYLALEKDACRVFSEGKLNLSVDYGQLKVNTVGNALHNIPGNEFSSRLMMTFDFLFSEEALNVFANELDSIPGISPMNIRDDFYIKSLRELLGKSQADKMQADLGLFAEYRNIPVGLQKTLVLSDVKPEWNPNTRTYRYEGEVDIVRIGNNMVNRRVELVMELTKRRSGDLLDMYFRLDDNSWYYFGYNPGSLQVVSSNRQFNQILLDTKEGDRKMRVKLGDVGYIYSAASNRRAQLFLRRFEAGQEQ